MSEYEIRGFGSEKVVKMVSDSPTLAEFLLACFAEDEDAARQAGSQPWVYGTNTCGFFIRVDGVGSILNVDGGIGMRGVGRHMLRWEPARVQAECDAKRRIVELHKAEDRSGGWGAPPEWRCSECGGRSAHPNLGWVPFARSWPCDTLRLLALSYADRPGYREEWRP